MHAAGMEGMDGPLCIRELTAQKQAVQGNRDLASVGPKVKGGTAFGAHSEPLFIIYSPPEIPGPLLAGPVGMSPYHYLLYAQKGQTSSIIN